MEQKKDGSLYICGCPGTGKSLSMEKVRQQAFDWAKQVLWPGCGWETVSLTDLITSSAVKKVCRKATLYVHPDKVQQKGATLEQKYIAEKVFDILKERFKC